MGDVPERHGGLGVREMLELVVVGEIADRPDAGHVRGHRVVDCNGAMVVAFDARGIDVEEVAVRLAAGGHQQFVDHRLADRTRDLDAVGDPLDLGRHVSEHEIDSLPEDLGEPLRHVAVELAQQDVRPVEDRHVRAQPREHMAHLDRDEPTTDDAEPLRELRQSHDRVGRVESRLHQPRDRRHDRARTGSEQDVRSRDAAAFDVEGARIDEVGRSFDERHVRCPVRPVLATAVRDRIDASEDAISDRRPICAVELRVDAEFRRRCRRHRHIGGIDEHLRRDASPIEAGTAEHVALDDGDLPVVEVGRDRVPRSAPHDDQIERFGGLVDAHEEDPTV